MVQLWVNLPKKDKGVAPHYQAITAEQITKKELPGNQGRMDVIAGTLNGVTGPAQTYTPVVVANLRLNTGARFETSLPAGYNTALLVINGSANVNGQPAPEHSFVLFANKGEDITIEATANSVILLLSGEPIDEPIVSYGPFVMNTKEEILQSIREAQTGKFGVLED
jgi:redox-sensitive bicupin YhaK (pirin superfamily)